MHCADRTVDGLQVSGVHAACVDLLRQFGQEVNPIINPRGWTRWRPGSGALCRLGGGSTDGDHRAFNHPLDDFSRAQPGSRRPSLLPSPMPAGCAAPGRN